MNERPLFAAPPPGTEIPPGLHDALTVAHGESQPQVLPLIRPTISIGRESSCDVRLAGRAVSRRHARLERRGAQWYVVDLGSTNGSLMEGKPLPAQTARLWEAGEPLQIGPYSLWWQPAEPAQEEKTVVAALPTAETADRPILPDDDLLVSLSPETIDARVDGEAGAHVRIANHGAVEKELQVLLSGLPASCYTVSPRIAVVGPRRQLIVRIQFEAIDQTVAGGEHPYQVVLQDLRAPHLVTTLPGLLVAPQAVDCRLSVLTPTVRNHGRVQVLLHNTGNVADTYTLELLGRHPELETPGALWQTALMPGSTDEIAIPVAARRRPLFGRHRSTPLDLEARSAHGAHQRAVARFVITPRIPLWAPIALLFAALLAAVWLQVV